MPHLSVVIPVYKAEGCLGVLYERLKHSLEQITQDFEIILVEDCGGDRSWDIILELAQKDSRVRGRKCCQVDKFPLLTETRPAFC
ncbi:glycosyltransferase [Cylindrospermopsis curvispora]|uniref:Glycosyltransferase n=1 Tax=Cylindrospermopsis curvispora GIHE-G1 TaxID=2666332 RepID=A0A7H0F1R7_9CYAN|nr:glycosyltransferase [Cylindrospermopsis curvispora]QNP29983.1 glycosyltransferase [Cylindrospermopsis curvispora GIHE-G1]